MEQRKPQNTRMLIVDDDKDLREVLAFSFKRMGYQVLSASNGKEAFKLIQSNPVDAVISDICMPGGSGIELLERAKELCPETPIILLVTGYTDISTEEAHNKGAEALFSKPLDKREIEQTILRLLAPAQERWANPVERRDSERIDVELEVELEFQGLAAAIDSKVLNLGRGGMFVTLPRGHFPNMNDTIAFRITFDRADQALDGVGVVRWVRTKGTSGAPAGCGIEFTHLSKDGKTQVLEYLNARRPKAFIPSE